MDKNSKYVVLRGIEEGNVFWTTNNPKEDMAKLADGTIAYDVIGYAETPSEAIEKVMKASPQFIFVKIGF